MKGPPDSGRGQDRQRGLGPCCHGDGHDSPSATFLPRDRGTLTEQHGAEQATSGHEVPRGSRRACPRPRSSHAVLPAAPSTPPSLLGPASLGLTLDPCEATQTAPPAPTPGTPLSSRPVLAIWDTARINYFFASLASASRSPQELGDSRSLSILPPYPPTRPAATSTVLDREASQDGRMRPGTREPRQVQVWCVSRGTLPVAQGLCCWWGLAPELQGLPRREGEGGDTERPRRGTCPRAPHLPCPPAPAPALWPQGQQGGHQPPAPHTQRPPRSTTSWDPGVRLLRNPLAQPRRGEGQLLWQLPDPVQTKAEADSQTNSSRTKHPRHLVSGHRRMHPRGSSRA